MKPPASAGSAALAMLRVGFIGLGDQGAPMARRIAQAGFPTTIWARRVAALDPFVGSGVAVASSPAEVGQTSDIVCLCVLDDAGVLDVGTGVLEGLAEGGVLVVHSTVHPDTCRTLAAKAARRGVSVVDAPVSGGGAVAAEGCLLVMAGGDAADVARCRPVFDTYAEVVLHLGPLGAGQVAKLLNNLAFTAHLATATNLFALGRALDVDPAALAEVLSHGTGRSYGIEVTAGLGFTAAAADARAGVMLSKDIALLADVVARAGTSAGVLLDVANAGLELLTVQAVRAERVS